MAVGNPPAAYQWQFNGINLTDSGRITGSQSNCLVVANAQVGDVGLYQVVVTNAYFSVTSAAATLEVNEAPAVLVQPQSQNVPLGATDTVAVITSGWPPPGYQWRYDGTNLADSARITGSQSNALSIANALASDAGNYDVIITNAYGSITSAVAVLKVPSQAPPPTNVAPTVIWAQAGGGPVSALGALDEIDWAAADGRGGLYAAGVFSQYARFGDIEMSAPPGYRNFFLVKYDASGKAVWGKNGAYDGAGADDYNTAITGLAASPDGGVVAVGYGLAPATIDGQLVDMDSNTNIAAGCPECAKYGPLQSFAFLVKYDANGTRLWFHTIYSYSIDSNLAIDALGNILLVEHLAGVADIDGQPIHVGFSSPSALDYNSPEYLLRFDSTGQFQALKTIMTPGDPNELIDQIGGGVDVDAEGNLYVTGHFIAPGGLGIGTYTLNFGSISLSATRPRRHGHKFLFHCQTGRDWRRPVGQARRLPGSQGRWGRRGLCGPKG